MLPQPMIGFSSKAYQSLAEAKTWAKEMVLGFAKRNFDGTGTYVCVPYPVLPLMIDWMKDTKMEVGVQDVSRFSAGPHTGDVPAELLADIGCRYTMIGHPERRREHGEDYEIIATKVGRACEAGIVPVLVVGEDDPKADVRARLNQQISDSLKLVSPDADVVFAYEPAWAIGKAEAAPGDHIAKSMQILHELMSGRPGARVVYGGSAKPGTFKSIVAASGGEKNACPDGVFLGRAGLSAETFLTTIDEVLENQ